MTNLSERAHAVRQAILSATLPADLQTLIEAAYRQLQGSSTVPLDVAVRSSATAEDLPDASFAGQQETYLNVHGTAALLETCKRCFASLFTDRAISYRVDKGFDHFKVALTISVQRMVRSDLACSGVMFTIDTETGFRDAVMISAAYGLGENVVQGSVTPGEFLVFKPTLKTGHRLVLQKMLVIKELKLFYNSNSGKMAKNIPVAPADRAKLALTDDEVLELARWACIVEDLFSAKRGQDGLEIYLMCEIPTNVSLAEEFAELFDGFSIGSNDLTQLILGVDRDSKIVAPIFDERNAAVKKMIAQVIATCRAKGRKIGICGQAPSDYPEFAQFLVEQGIESISLNPDTVLKTTLAVLATEQTISR
jgi:phosphoenolpyruvate synthase/pyruvate phosphate dikinase